MDGVQGSNRAEIIKMIATIFGIFSALIACGTAMVTLIATIIQFIANLIGSG